MPRTINATLAIGVWAADEFRPAGAVIGMRPSHGGLLGVNLPDEQYARGFPELPDDPGLWIVSCDAELPVAYDELDAEDVLSFIGVEQMFWLSATAAWRPANSRDLYILRGETPPGEGD